MDGGLTQEALNAWERCNRSERVAVTRAKLAQREGKVAVMLDVPMEECPSCGDRRLARDVAERLDELFRTMLAGDVEAPLATSPRRTTAA